MISQCSVCGKTYSTKDFRVAKKRLCPECRKATKDEPTIDEGRMPEPVPLPVSGTKPLIVSVKQQERVKEQVKDIVKKELQRSLVWAK